MRRIVQGLSVLTAIGLAAGLAMGPVAPTLAQEPAKKTAKAKPGAKKPGKKVVAKKVAAKSGACTVKGGRGWAPTEAMARFQAWEIVAQTTGNWPIQTDTFRNERYRCKPEGAQWRCDSWIEVCRKS